MAKNAEGATMQPIDVVKVETGRLQTWSLAVARTNLNQILGDNFQKNKPVEYEKLQNLLATIIEGHKSNEEISS